MKQFICLILLVFLLSCHDSQNYKQVQIVFSAGNNPSEFPQAFRIENNGNVSIIHHPNSGQSSLCGKLSSSQLESTFLEFRHLEKAIDKYGDDNFEDGVWIELIVETQGDAQINSHIFHMGEMNNSDYQKVENIIRTCELFAVENCSGSFKTESKLFNEKGFIPPIPE